MGGALVMNMLGSASAPTLWGLPGSGCSEMSKDPRKYWTSRPGWDRDVLERDRRERALTPAPLRAPSGVYPSYPP
jgi:hypothetical protein